MAKDACIMCIVLLLEGSWFSHYEIFHFLLSGPIGPWYILLSTLCELASFFELQLDWHAVHFAFTNFSHSEGLFASHGSWQFVKHSSQ